MGFKLRKRIKVAPGININVSKKGVSATVGGKGASVNVGKNGTYLNTNIPGTGLYDRQRLDNPAQEKEPQEVQFSPAPTFADYGANSWGELSKGDKFWFSINLLVWFVVFLINFVLFLISSVIALGATLLALGFWVLVCYIMYKLFW